MHVADFSGRDGSESGGKFQQVREKLDYLCDLGINAIELMPVNEYPGDYSWGYKVRDFFAVESSYGETADLKQLIDECHGRGIRVILEGIYNHCDEECPLLVIDRNYWYYRNKHYPEDPANYWGSEFYYENFDPKLGIRPAWKFIGDVVNFWIQEYHIDGIRYDAVRQLNNRDFLHWITREAKKKPLATSHFTT
ncbi:alpha-amylase family glycosyl hydrolase [Microcoleus vaginatus]|uniref:alpha-amylase family glycosyl hydrolase n=1 Tax=Microcoleus vaginatus TaxID=119532 RepID=UPI004040AD41